MNPSTRKTIQLLGGALVCALSLAACAGDTTTSNPDAAAPSCASGATACGASCCTADQVCMVNGTCCTRTPCGTRVCGGSDGCGGTCGSCPSGQSCDDTTGTCAPGCTRETVDQFCSRLAQSGKVCGVVADQDNCTQATRLENCGDCFGDGVCLSDNTCSAASPDACVPWTTTEFCDQMALSGKLCGQVGGADNCGGSRSEDCGGCGAGASCSPTNTCVPTCQPKTDAQLCAALGKNCGTLPATDNCQVQRQLDCGSCADGTCQSNVCVACTYEDATAFCARMALQGLVCGIVSGVDLCGAARQEDCGTSACTGGAVCDYATNACSTTCTEETDAQFCARVAAKGKVCGLVADLDNCTQLPKTVDCGFDACTNGSSCSSNNACVGPAATCASPVVLQPDSSSPDLFLASGDTSKGPAKLDGSCGPGSGAEVVYQLNVGGATPRSLAATVTASTGSSLSPVLYFRPTCESATNEVCDAASPAAMVWMDSVDPGAYFLVVDSASASEQGAFSLHAELGTADSVPANDTCAAPVTMTFVQRPAETDFEADATATTCGANDDYTGTCSGPGAVQDGGDVVFTFDLPAGPDKALTIQVFPDYESQGYAPAIFVRTLCGDSSAANELGCTNTGLLTLPDVVPGTYFIIVGGMAGTCGGFTVQILTNPVS